MDRFITERSHDPNEVLARQSDMFAGDTSTLDETAIMRIIDADREVEIEEGPDVDDVNVEIERQVTIGKSGTRPLMTQKQMSADIKQSAIEVEEYDSDIELKYAQEVVDNWTYETKRGLSSSERVCLIAAVCNNPDQPPSSFHDILLGYTLKSDQLAVECRNVLQAVQEQVNSALASQREFSVASKRLLDGMQTMAMKPTHRPAPAPGITIPAPIVIRESAEPKLKEKVHDEVPTARAINLKILEEASKGDSSMAEEFVQKIGKEIFWLNAICKKDPPEVVVGQFLGALEITVEDIDQNNKSRIAAAFITHVKNTQ